MKLKGVGFVLVALCVAHAANSQDEQLVRNTYAKLAYAVSSRTVYDFTRKHPNGNSADLAKELQAKELRFEISDISSGNVADILSRAYSDFVSRPDAQDSLLIVHDEETFDENGKRATSYFAVPHWTKGSVATEDWDVPVKTAFTVAGTESRFVRYVTATVTVRLQGRSRTYRTLWLFSDSDVRVIDPVTGNSILSSFAKESAYPSVLTDTSLRSRAVVNDWLHSTQRFEASCKTGKQDVCCDSTMHCGVSAGDLESTKSAPNTTATPKGGL